MATRTARRLLLVLPALASVFVAQVAPSAQSQSLVVRNVTLIDGTGAAAQPGTTVVVTGNRITGVGGNAAVPAGAQVVDGTGKFLIPGLWDMHLHLRGDSRVPRFTTFGEVLLVANGVTGVRLMAGLPRFFEMQKGIQAGELAGPRMFLASRNFDGPIASQKLPPKRGDTAGEAEEWQSVGAGEIPRAYQITNTAHARAAVAEAKASGVEFLKIHNELTPEAYFAIAAEAKANGLYLTGHVPTGVPVSTLSDTGMRSIEHWAGYLEGCSTREDEILKGQLAALSLPAAERGRRNAELRRMAVDSYSAEKCAALAARFVKQGTWISPTLMPEGGARATADRNADLAKYVFAPLRARWQQQIAAAPAAAPAPSAAEQELARAVEQRRRDIIAVMKKGGVPFVVGTDSGGAWRIPGRSLHEGLQQMVKAGLTPMETIVAATTSSARLLRRDKDLGSVQTGKLADMVLLDANPLQDIANTQRINAVVLNGRLMDRKTLDGLLAQMAAANATN
jgi:imidazolonepropionase-like amidohydrolase